MSIDPLDKIRQLLPLRDLPAQERERLGITREGVGRPRTIEPRPVRDDYLGRLDELRGEALALDPVLSACRRSDDKDGVLDQSIAQVAVEAAALAFDRQQAEKRGVDVSALCSRRVSALSQLSSLILERARLGGEGDFDVRGPKFVTVVAYFHELLSETAVEVMGPELAEKFVKRYRDKVAGWQDRVDPPRAPRE